MATLYELGNEWGDFLEREGLPARCAEELLHEDITPEQRRWISQFIIRWDAVAEPANA